MLVDEFQDLDVLKIQIARLLYRKNKHQIWFVGDPDQSIYEFRGLGGLASKKIKELFPKIQVHFLYTNYRNSQNIQEAANKIISKNVENSEHRINLKVERVEGEKINCIMETSVEWEQEKVAIKIEELIYKKRIDPRNIAVLYRMGNNSERIEKFTEALGRHEIPFINHSDKREMISEKYIIFSGEDDRFVDILTIHKAKGRE